MKALAKMVTDVRNELPPPLPEPASYADALRKLVDRNFLGSTKHRQQHLRANRAGATSDLLAFERAFCARFRKLGIPMYAHCVVRDAGEQQRLYVQGRSMARPGRSPHQYGMAVDLVHGRLHWELPRSCWEIIGHVGLEVAQQAGVKVVWGGSFEKLWDPAHWELADWRSRVAATLLAV